MEKEKNIHYIGHYQILRSIGKGGMGEVFLVFDPICDREVALKCIRSDLKHKKAIQHRFLREAKIASQLTHPSIIPIYSIHQDPSNIYYTMSYVEGETLRQILRGTREQEKKGTVSHPIGKSIPALSRIFLQVCEAIAYAHSKGVLHRDLKPENIIVGRFGEAMILDWGIADYIGSPPQREEEEDLPEKAKENLTRPGKVAGTIAYMAPERALGSSSSVLSDIYALGVILYQILTLQLPFNRGNLQAFRKTMKDERLLDPIEVAPYREIPHGLIAIVKKCLAYPEKGRYQSVEALIEDLKNIIEGKPEWVLVSELSMDNREDWEFQENVLFAKHAAITRQIDVSEWISLMVSRETFSENIRISAEISIHNQGQGIGFLFNIPEASERKRLEEGYCLWLGSSAHPSCKLFRSNVLVMDLADISLSLEKNHEVIIEKANDHVTCTLDGSLILSYNSHIPFAGSHIGLLLKDADVSLKKFQVFMGSHNVMVNCLAVPDAFFAQKNYDMALMEYRKIGKCFPGRAEGREALFRAGIALLEKAKMEKGKKEKADLFELAHREFENLHQTPGAPLEYMGKSMVYQAMLDSEEEAKCLEFALRKFPKHPLLPILEEHIIYRMHESSQQMRGSAYRMILLAIRYFPKVLKNKDTYHLIHNLEKNWEILPFLDPPSPSAYSNQHARLAVILSFWLSRKEALVEIIKALAKHEACDENSIENDLFCLLELGWYKEVKEMIMYLEMKPVAQRNIQMISHALMSHFKPAVSSLKSFFSAAPAHLARKEARVLLHILKKALLHQEKQAFEFFLQKKRFSLDKEDQILLDSLLLWHFLCEKQLEKASEIVNRYEPSQLKQETSPLFTPYGAFLYVNESPEMAMSHYSTVSETAFPPTTSLAAHYLTEKITEKNGWMKEAFLWEKQQLYQQLALFFLATGDYAQYKQWEKKSHLHE